MNVDFFGVTINQPGGLKHTIISYYRNYFTNNLN